MTVIAIDYDDTFTDNPRAWAAVVAQLKSQGCTVIGVTLSKKGDVW